MYKCLGCGAMLQDKDDKKPGYVSEKVLIEKSNAICKRCFKIKNYGEYIPVKLSKEDYVKEVKKVLPSSELVILVVDIIEFSSSMDEDIITLIKDKPVILVVNKMDILPRQMNPSKTAVWIHERLKEYKLKVLDVAMISNISNYGVNGILRKINHFYKNGVNAVVMGATNVGKSTLINNYLAKNSVLTVSKYPGTTLNFVKMRIPDTKIVLIDTPGIIPKGRISDEVCEKCNLKIVPTKKVVVKRIKLDFERVIMLNGLLFIQNINNENERPIIDIYTGPDISVHETNIDKAEELMDRTIVNEIIKIPCDECIDTYYDNEFVYTEYSIPVNSDFVIKGLGWIAVRRGPLNIKVKAPKNVEFITREVFIK